MATLAIFIVGCGLLALHFGQTANWDLRNYHLYNPYAWLNDRAAIDLAPAGLQTFFNPLLHVPAYLGTRYLSPAWLTFLLGCVQGLNVLPLFVLARGLLPGVLPRAQVAWPLAIAMVGATGATQLGELGATQGDNLLSLPLLCAAALLFAERTHAAAGWRRTLFAGLLAGVALGLKLTVAPIVAGLFVGAAFIHRPPAQRLRAASVFAAAAFAGLLLSGGFWMWDLYQRFGDPFYPLLGPRSPSPLAVPFATHDARWFPRATWHVLAYPWAWTLDWRLTSDLKFRDLRLPLLYAAALLLPWWRRRPALGKPDASSALFASMLAAYAIWLAMFGYYRYLAAIEMLAPLAFVLLLLRTFPHAPRAPAAAIAALIVMFAGTNPANWDRVSPGERFLQVVLPPEHPLGAATVVMAGQAPLGYLVLAFPPKVSFIRIEGAFFGGSSPPFAFDRLVAKRLDAATGPLLAMVEDRNRRALDLAFARFGLRVDYASCAPIESNLSVAHEGPIVLCRVARERPAL